MVMGTDNDGPRLVAVSHTNVLGGAERLLVRTLALAKAEGWRVSCVAPPGELAELLSNAGVRHETGPDLRRHGPGPASLASLGARWAHGATQMRALLGTADVVLANGIRALPALRVAPPAAPVAWWVHDVIGTGGLRHLCKLCAPAVDGAFAVSEAAAELPRRLGLPTTVVHHGTPWPVPPAPDQAPLPMTIGTAAVLSPWKGQAVLLEAIARLGRPDVQVELLGKAPPKDHAYPAMLARLSRELGLDDQVHIVGQVPAAIDRMRQWALMVIPSTDPEAWPLVALEAMSIGIPVVATNHGGPAELLPGIGLLVRPSDPGDLARAIARLLDDPALRRHCREAGLNSIRNALVFEDQGRKLLDAMSELIKCGRRRRRRRSDR